MLDNFTLLLLSVHFFQKIIQEQYQSVRRLDPDQDRSFVGPDLGPNCLQRLSEDDSLFDLILYLPSTIFQLDSDGSS